MNIDFDQVLKLSPCFHLVVWAARVMENGFPVKPVKMPCEICENTKLLSKTLHVILFVDIFT